MNLQDVTRLKEIEQNTSGSFVVGQDAIDLHDILVRSYRESHPNGRGGQCPWCHSEDYCEHWTGLGWVNPNISLRKR